MSNDKPFRGRLLLVGAVTALALSIGGVAYAVTGDEASPHAEYVQIVNGGDRAEDERAAQDNDRRDCPEKRGESGGNAQNAADRL